MTGDDEDFSDAATELRGGQPSRRATTFALVVSAGPDAGLRATLVADTRTLVGTSPACAVRLHDPSVSRRHAAISIEEGRVRLVDLGSTNGTSIDGVDVSDAFLSPRQAARLGASAFRIEPLDEPAPELVGETSFGRVVGASAVMRRLYPVCARIAASTIPVVIEGETGTGKEVLAEALHEASPRAAEPFVVFDCTTVPANLVESELFGHERGAFTGAVSARKGVFEQARGGTLLIDEIGDLDLGLQPKLLRAIEKSEFRRVGGAQPIRLDVRIMAATRRDLDREVQEGRFRDDLFHRLAVARVELPPLRERKGDVPLLVTRFWADLGGAGEPPPDVLARFDDHAWPGNVRELRNAVARQIALGDLAALAVRDKSPAGAKSDFLEALLDEELALPVGRRRIVEEYERRYVARVLAKHHGVVGEAAAASGIARRYFQTIRARSGDK